MRFNTVLGKKIPLKLIRHAASHQQLQKSYVLGGDLMVYQDARRSEKHAGGLSQK